MAFAHLLFNCTGALIFLPFEPIRNLPVKFAEGLAELCLRNRVIPIVFIVLVFYLIPIGVTWSTISKVFKEGKAPLEQTVPSDPDADANGSKSEEGKAIQKGE